MVSKTRKIRKRVSKRVLQNVVHTVWGKNTSLESFWSVLASGKKVVLIYKDGTHTYADLPKRTTRKYQDRMVGFEEDKSIVAILSSNPSQDAYEQYLYPKAKNSSVDSVIKHYTKYFKPLTPDSKMRIPL
jgi:hypothetical protein